MAQFILPADRRIAEAFEHSVVHLHPSRFIPSRQLADTGVDMIELHIDKGGPPAESLESTPARFSKDAAVGMGLASYGFTVERAADNDLPTFGTDSSRLPEEPVSAVPAAISHAVDTRSSRWLRRRVWSSRNHG